MKKQKPKSRKICRKKGQNEPEIDLEHQKQVNALAIQFKEDKLKAVLRRCYDNVQKYGPEAIMKAVEDSWTAMTAVGCQGIVHSSFPDKDAFVKMEEEVVKEHLHANVEVALQASMQGDLSRSHDHEETSKRNALFLIECSEGLEDYSSDALIEMKRAYKKGRYDDVSDLAYLHDRQRRPSPQPSESQVNDNITFHRETPESPWHRISELLEEVAEHIESPLKCCVEAIRQLSRDLTYDNNAAAKESIRKAIKYLEE